MSEPTKKGSGKARKIVKYLGVSAAVLVAVLFVADIVWERSGTNEWKLASDTNGIRVSTLKTPGYSLLKYKLNMHVDARLSDVVFYLTDTSTGEDLGAKEIVRLESVSSPQVSYSYDTYKLDLPPFGRRDVVIIAENSQDPVSKKVSINILAAANKKPLDSNITRVEHLSNTWTLTPLASGGVDIEAVSEVDLGIPYFMANQAMPGIITGELSKMPVLLKKDKYKNKKLAFITELDEKPAIAKR